MKFIKRTSTAEVVETKGNNHAETKDKVDIVNIDTHTVEDNIDSVDATKTVSDDDAPELEELERQSIVGTKTGPATDFTDVGLWPVEIDHKIRAMLVWQGSAAVQHLDHEFMIKEVTRPGIIAKGDIRKLMKNWFFQNMRNREKSL